MAKEYIRGKRQEVVVGAAADFVFWETPHVDGRPVIPSADPMITIEDWGISGETMAAVPATDSGYLAFDAQTAEFTIGSTLTGATSGARAIIKAIYSSSDEGVLLLENIDGVFVDDENISDNGPNAGAATAASDIWTGRYVYELDASAISGAEGVTAAVEWQDDAGTVRTDYFLVDAVRHPYDPLITSRDIDEAHPDWLAMRQPTWGSWWPAIQDGHAELSRRISAQGRRAALIIDREKLRPVELAFVEKAIAIRSTRMTAQERDYWAKRAESEYAAMGALEYDEDDDGDADVRVIASSRLVR